MGKKRLPRTNISRIKYKPTVISKQSYYVPAAVATAAALAILLLAKRSCNDCDVFAGGSGCCLLGLPVVRSIVDAARTTSPPDPDAA